MNDLWPIFVPSKGRPDSSTLKLLQASGILATILLEKKDMLPYQHRFPKDFSFMQLPESDQGIAYVRQFILDHARETDIGWYWMLDDDITGFFRVRERKCHRTDVREVLLAAQDVFNSFPNVSQGALEYQQYAWSAGKQHSRNGYCDVCVCINAQRTRHCNYRAYVALKEDRDFTLQILNSGYETARASWCAFSAPKNGSNPGGLQEEYKKTGREEIASRRMEELWPGVCTFEPKKDGRPDVKINWRFFKK